MTSKRSIVVILIIIISLILFPSELMIDFINFLNIYPVVYWITYISAIIGVLTVIITLFWYGNARKKFSSPIKKKKFSSVKIILTIITILGIIQLILSLFAQELLYQLTSIIFITLSVFFGFKTFVNLSTSLLLRPKIKEFETTPSVSIIIPAYNEAKVIEKTIRSVLDLSYSQKEIIVVDDGSKDDTLKIAKFLETHNPIRVISKKKNGGKWHALNKGIELSRSDIIVCIDADTVLDKNAIQPLVSHFSDSKVGAVAGNIKVGNRDKLLTKLQALEYISNLNIQRRSEAFFGIVTVVPGPLGAFRRSIIKEVGFYTGDTFAEDADLTFKILRAGYKIKYEPKSIGYTEAPISIFDLAKQRYRWYRGFLQVIIKHKGMFFNPKYGTTGLFMIPWVSLNGLIFSWFNYFAGIWIFIFIFNPFSGFLIYTRIYFFWFFFFLIIEIAISTYAIYVDVREKPRILFYIIAYKLFYGYMTNTIRILSQLEQYLKYPMKWEAIKRTSAISLYKELEIH
ncbi:MAG: glycosyltransferase [Candidatus Hodarchaeota archaeon]